MKKFLLVAALLFSANAWCMDLQEEKQAFLEKQREYFDENLWRSRRHIALLQRQGKQLTKSQLLALVLEYLNKDILDSCGGI